MLKVTGNILIRQHKLESTIFLQCLGQLLWKVLSFSMTLRKISLSRNLTSVVLIVLLMNCGNASARPNLETNLIDLGDKVPVSSHLVSRLLTDTLNIGFPVVPIIALKIARAANFQSAIPWSWFGSAFDQPRLDYKTVITHESWRRSSWRGTSPLSYGRGWVLEVSRPFLYLAHFFNTDSTYRVETPFIIGIWILFASIAKIG